MGKVTIGILGAAALAAGVVVLRMPRQQVTPSQRNDSSVVPALDRTDEAFSLERLRALGY